METKFIVPDITCGGCANSIQRALGQIDGIDEVLVDIAAKEVIVVHSESVKPEFIAKTLDEIGFTPQTAAE